MCMLLFCCKPFANLNGFMQLPMTFGECACYIVVTVAIYGRWCGSKTLTMHFWQLTSSAGKRFAPMPPSIYGSVRGTYVIATAVTCLHACRFL